MRNGGATGIDVRTTGMRRFFLKTLVLLMAGCAGAPLCCPAQHRVARNGDVLAYGLSFNPDDSAQEMPEALQEMLRQYSTGQRRANRVAGTAVSPLLSSVRDQDDPYNRACPYYMYSDSTLSSTRCLTGCVATCMEQVLSYWQYPEATLDTLFGWQTDHYTIDAVMPGQVIDWDNILPDYRNGYTDEQATAIANLSYWLGIACRMSWGVSSSGASLSRARTTLRRVFGYKTVDFVQRSFYTDTAWNMLLRHELEQGRPVCYTGHNMALSGHAFNIDGVDADGYYHLNWGYNGRYDGWFDLDYLNPFEPASQATTLGQAEGFFCNQTAMLLCPDSVTTLAADSLPESVALGCVEVEDFSFRRSPDTQGYVIADAVMHNTSQSDLNFTFEVLTNLPTDTALFVQGDYVALSAVHLDPGERKDVTIYCQFAETGNRTLGMSDDDQTFFYSQPVEVAAGTEPVLKWGELSLQMLQTADGELRAQFSLPVSNEAESGTAGNLVTYNLLPEGGDENIRHWDILSLPAGQQDTLSVRYDQLTEGQTYTLAVRCPWTIQAQLTFTATAEGAADGVATVALPAEQSADGPWYDLSGRRAVRPRGGIFLRNGRKTLIP